MLLKYPKEWTILHKKPPLIEQAMEELLRCAGLPRVLFRRALEDFKVDGVHVRKGERIVLKVMAANRDPEHFSRPDQVDVKRNGKGQLALGAGPHSCVGASLIRMAAITITRPLLERFALATLTQPVEWKGGSGFRSPVALWVQLSDSAL
jgi:cytochrome P450